MMILAQKWSPDKGHFRLKWQSQSNRVKQESAQSVEMAVGPAEGDLQHIMEIGDGSLAADEQPAPDRRADLDERDVKLVDFQVGRSVGYRVLPSSASITTRRAWHDEASMTPYC